MELQKVSDHKADVEIIESTNIVQPSVVTFASYDYTLTQIKILVQIIEELQTVIKEAITNEKNKVAKQLSLFTDAIYQDDEDPTAIKIKLPFAKLGIGRNQYKTVKAALAKMVTIPIEVPYYDKSGQLWREIGGLCRVRYPDKKQITEVEIIIQKKTAEHLLNIRSKGYTEFLKEVISLSKNQYTPRFYMLLAAHAKRTATVRISMKVIRKLFRLEEKYKIYRDFDKNVLQPAYFELKEKADNHLAEFFFEYQKGYFEGRRKVGEPDYISFDIVPIDIDKVEEQDDMLIQQYVHNLLTSEHILMEEKKALEISKSVNHDNKEGILNKIMTLVEYMNSPKNKITNKPAYAYKVLKEYLKEIGEI